MVLVCPERSTSTGSAQARGAEGNGLLRQIDYNCNYVICCGRAGVSVLQNAIGNRIWVGAE